MRRPPPFSSPRAAAAGEDARTDIWPWIASGDPGRVAVALVGNDKALPGSDAELAGTADGWNVHVAQTTAGLGCPKSPNPGFRVARVTPQAFHVGHDLQGRHLAGRPATR